MFDDHTTLDVLKINFALFILFQGILHVIIKKMKYDESYNFEHEVCLCYLVVADGLAFLLPTNFLSLLENLTSAIKIMHGGAVAS